MEKEIISFLQKKKIKFVEYKHKEVYTCKEQAKALGIKEAEIAKSLIFKSNNSFFLAVAPGNKSVNRKRLEETVGKKVELATPAQVKKIADCNPGAVHPFGSLMKIKVYIDKQLLKNKYFYISPASLTKTLKISRDNYLKIENPTIMEFEMKKKKKQGIGITVKKEEDLTGWYTELIQKAELADYTEVSGCMVFRPYCYSMWEIIQQATDAEFKKIGIKNAYFPLFIPEKLLQKESTHVEGFSPEVAWVTHAGDSKLSERLAVRPTSETIMYDSYKKWIRSWRDLPLKLNQWNNVVRWEFKHPIALMRTREFLWNEGHTVYASKEEAEKEKNQILGIYQSVLKDYMALYGIVGRKTEKEKFAGAEYTCSIEFFLPNGRGVQGPDFHHDGQNFSKAFDIKFLNKDEKKEYAWQNTFAITTRMLGVMMIIHGDNKGLVLPPKIAPVQIIIVPISPKDKEKILEKANDVKNTLKGYRVKVDDREEYTPGWKYNEWELKGVPLRVEIGPRDLDKKQVILVRRDNSKKEAVKLIDVPKKVKEVLEDIHNVLYEKSKKNLLNSIVKVKTMDELKRAIKDKKLALAPFCGKRECEDWIKDKTGGITSRCIPFDKKPKKGDKCVHCNKEASCVAYFAKSY